RPCVARRRHRAPDTRGDRRPRHGPEGGARVTEEPAATEPVPARVGAPVRGGGPPDRQGTLKDLSRPGRRAFSLPELDVPEAPVPADQARQAAPGLPEVAERDLVSHYTRLSQLNYGVDTGFYPLGSCSMKYNPKIAENVGQLAGFQRAHPHQPDHSVQGSLELMWRLERALCEITGMARAALDPPPGPRGQLTGLLVMRAHHERKGRQRRRVAIPDSSHGTNPASVRLAGYQGLKIPSDARGLVDVSALEKLIDEDVAGLMLTNPNTLGMFEGEIERTTEAVHRIGGLVYYDGANLNAILGRCRPGDMGFDIVHINTHKTFATPHGGGGPGGGPGGGARRPGAVRAGPSGRTRRGRRVPARQRGARFDRADARVPRQLRCARPCVRVRVPARPRRAEGGRRPRRAQRELPRRAREGGVPPGPPGRAADA